VDRPPHVDVERHRAQRVVLLEEAPHRHDARVVDEHVDGPDGVVHRIEERGERCPRRHVDLERVSLRTDRPRGVVGGVAVEVAEADAGAAPRELLGRRAADPAAGAGDDHDRFCEVDPRRPHAATSLRSELHVVS